MLVFLCFAQKDSQNVHDLIGCVIVSQCCHLKCPWAQTPSLRLRGLHLFTLLSLAAHYFVWKYNIYLQQLSRKGKLGLR